MTAYQDHLDARNSSWADAEAAPPAPAPPRPRWLDYVEAVRSLSDEDVVRLAARLELVEQALKDYAAAEDTHTYGDPGAIGRLHAKGNSLHFYADAALALLDALAVDDTPEDQEPDDDQITAAYERPVQRQASTQDLILDDLRLER